WRSPWSWEALFCGIGCVELAPAAGPRRGFRVLGWGGSKDDLEVSRELADPRLGNRLEVDQQQLAVDRVADAGEHAVSPALRVAVDEDLCGEQLAAPLLDFHVDVRRATGVGYRLDGAEVILALGAGGTAAEALKVRVPRPAAAVRRVEVDAAAVNLPDLDN